MENAKVEVAILSQGCRSISEERGRQVHIVVKNSPFLVELGLLPSPDGELSSMHMFSTVQSVEAEVVYDGASENDYAEVNFLRETPLQYTLGVVRPDGQYMPITCRLRVLSSQHEDCLFRVKFTLAWSSCPRIILYSAPIRVISKAKPSHVQRRAGYDADDRSEPVDGGAFADSELSRTPKRARRTSEHHGGGPGNPASRMADQLTEAALDSLISMQRENLVSLCGLLPRKTAAGAAPSSSAVNFPERASLNPGQLSVAVRHVGASNEVASTVISEILLSNPSEETSFSAMPQSAQPTTSHHSLSVAGGSNLLGNSSDQRSLFDHSMTATAAFELAVDDLMDPRALFHNAFASFWNVFRQLPEDQKPLVLRRIVRKMPLGYTSLASEFIDLLSSTQVMRMVGSAHDKSSTVELDGCSCLFCPYRDELQKIEEYYHVFSRNDDDSMLNI